VYRPSISESSSMKAVSPLRPTGVRLRLHMAGPRYPRLAVQGARHAGGDPTRLNDLLPPPKHRCLLGCRDHRVPGPRAPRIGASGAGFLARLDTVGRIVDAPGPAGLPVCSTQSLRVSTGRFSDRNMRAMSAPSGRLLTLREAPKY